MHLVVFSQLTDVKFFEVAIPPQQAILNIIGSQLRSLEFKRCGIDIGSLASCIRLENLKIDSCRIIGSLTKIQGDTFLPQLKELVVKNGCLSRSSHLLERVRPHLFRLSLCCTHLGRPNVSDFNWKDLALMYPNLESLSISYLNSRQRRDRIRNPYIFQRMSKLKNVDLPQDTDPSVDLERTNNQCVFTVDGLFV